MKIFYIFYSKYLVISKKSSTFALAVPVIPLPDMMLVMNPGFLFLWQRVN